MEKLLVCDALDERDFLKKKINNTIKVAEFISVKRVQDIKVNNTETVEEFSGKVTSTLQSIKDMIKRYQNIDAAITLSNATTKITTKSGKIMTVAAAIALRKSLVDRNLNNADFNGHLINRLQEQYDYAVMQLRRLNDIADNQSEKLKDSFVSKDNKKISSEDIESLEQLTKGLYGEMVDPVKIKEEIDKLSEDYNVLLKELETAIKVSNATTTIEF